MLSLCKITERPAVCQSALYTLAMATEGNGEFCEEKIKHRYTELKQLLHHQFCGRCVQWPHSLFLDQVVQVQTQAGDIGLFTFVRRHLTPTAPLSNQVYK